jgi:hypothetical protein
LEQRLEQRHDRGMTAVFSGVRSGVVPDRFPHREVRILGEEELYDPAAPVTGGADECIFQHVITVEAVQLCLAPVSRDDERALAVEIAVHGGKISEIIDLRATMD